MDAVPTIKIKPASPEQGEFVVINATDFDPAVHEQVEWDDTPIPGPFDHLSRQDMIDHLAKAARTYLEGASDHELLMGMHDDVAAHGPFENAPGADAPAGGADLADEFGGLTKAKLVELAAEFGVELPKKANKDEIVALLKAHRDGPPEPDAGHEAGAAEGEGGGDEAGAEADA